MCGISGIVGSHEPELIVHMNQVQSHRGPDGEGVYHHEKNQVSMGHRRLSIIDLDGGIQPMVDIEDQVCIVFNGEIFNSPELRALLEKDGYRFKTKNSDTEVLINLYKKKSFSMLNYLNGMFAFSIYDKQKKIFFCARDRMGIKPFYYCLKNGKFAFASELKALCKLPWVSKDIDFTSLYHYVSLQFIPAPESIFTDIFKLEKSQFLIYDIDKKNIVKEKYWQLSFNKNLERTTDQWCDLLLYKITEVIKRWTLSDVPIACSLSGGLDSSAIVGIMAQFGNIGVNTYSLGFSERDGRDISELHLARKVANKWKTNHHELILQPQQLINDLKQMVYHLDEPYGGGLPSWYVFKQISKDCKVVLTGVGGDELFGNYGKWAIHEKGVIGKSILLLKELYRYCTPRALPDALAYRNGHFYHKYFSDSAKDKFIFKDSDEVSIKTEALIDGLWIKSNQMEPKNSVPYVDFQLQLAEEFLHMTDRFSMAHSVEARVPLLDHELVDLVFSIPPAVRTKLDDPKYLLRKTVKKFLPEELIAAPKKGFVLPLDLWTRKDLKSQICELFSYENLRKQNIFSPKIWDKIVKPHVMGTHDNTQQVWTLFMFQLWYYEHF